MSRRGSWFARFMLTRMLPILGLALLAWISQGAKLNMKTPRVTSIEVSPKNPVLERIGNRHQIRVVAHYADGVVVGSVLVNRIAELGQTPDAIPAELQRLMAEMRQAMDSI